MNRCSRAAAEVRLLMGLQGRVDVEAVAGHFGMVVVPWRTDGQAEGRIGDFIFVSDRLRPDWRRWVIAHSIGHKIMHPGNHVWIYMHTGLGPRFEREAEDFACLLLIDGREAAAERLVYSWQVAEHFGVPDEMVRFHAHLILDPRSVTPVAGLRRAPVGSAEPAGGLGGPLMGKQERTRLW